LKKEGIDDDDLLSPEDQARYMSATAVLLHMMHWSRAEVMNAVRDYFFSRDCSLYMQSARKSHNKALNRVMMYCVGTPLRGLFLEPTETWDGISWKCLSLAIKRINRDVLITKVCNDLFPTADTLCKMKYQHHDTCILCHQPET
jgi:hypothetical protein